jgi:hypothetical protein
LERKPAPNDDPVGALRERLTKLSPAEVLEFHRELHSQLANSYTWGLWGAAYIVNGGCSDDCFEYFRAWLVMQGRRTFESVVRNPDSVADYAHVGRPAELEEVLSVAREVYAGMTGKQPDAQVRYPNLGDRWDFDDASLMKHEIPEALRQMSMLAIDGCALATHSCGMP